MKLKKIGMIAVSAMLLFSTAGCGEKEQEQPKQPESQTTMKQEQPAKEEKKRITNEKEILEKFPELKEVKEYLFENFPTLNREVQEKTEDKKTKPIEFTYTIKGEDADWFAISLNFEKSTTKKEMIEAMQYSFEKITNLFLEESNINFQFMANIAFTNEGIKIERYWDKWGRIELKYDKSEGKEPVWKEQRGKSVISSWREINPENVKPDEMVAYFGEETPDQPEVSEPQGTSIQLSTVLSHINLYYDTTESAREKDDQTGNEIVKGSNEAGSCTYEITTNDKGEVLSGIYKITRTTEATDEEFKMNVRGYLCNSASAQFDGETGMKAFQVVSKCVEDVFDRAEGAEEEGTLEGVKFKVVVEKEKEKECIVMYVTN